MSFLVEGATDSWFVEIRDGDELVGLAAVDMLDEGLAAIYTVFDPAYERRSLGTFAVLWQIEEAKRLGLPHLYLGYWKMNYKTRFRPNGQWSTS